MRVLRIVEMVTLGIGAVLTLWLGMEQLSHVASSAQPAAAGQAPLSVVVNEVAWMGTLHSATDEWIELLNNTPDPVSVDGWRLSDGGDIDVMLSGLVSPHGFFLLERTDDTTVSDVSADQIYRGSLHDAGESLTLTNEVGAVVDVVHASGGWPAGWHLLRHSMERVDPLEEGYAGNWVANSGVYCNGLDAGGSPIHGTPRQPNGAGYNRGSPGEVLITAVHYDGYQEGDLDEAFQLLNVATGTITLTGWTVSDDEVSFAISSALALAPGQSTWCARQAEAFFLTFGRWPGCVYGGDKVVGEVPNLESADLLVVRDTAGAAMDAVLWGEDRGLQAWVGPALQPYGSSGIAVGGQVLHRKRDEGSGLPLPDTDTSADWANDRTPADVLFGPVHRGDLYGKRVAYPGWDQDVYSDTREIWATAWLTVGIAPDNAYQVVAGLLERARESILIEGYTFESVWLASVLTERIAAGVQVTLLLEGAPAGGMPEQELWICEQIVDAGGSVYFLHNDPQAGIHDRYKVQHAKLIIADGMWLAVSSESPGNHAMPVDEKMNGTAGNRGVVLITDQREIVNYVQGLFARDCDPLCHQDVVAYGQVGRYVVPPTYTAVYSTGGGAYGYMAPFSSTVPAFVADRWEVIHAPETSLRYSDGLIGMVLRAGPGDQVYVEQLYERVHWGYPDSDPSSDPNPRLEAYIQAARQGARVRILLDKGFDDSHENYQTAYYALGVAQSEGLDLDVRVGDPTQRGIHNKMVLAQIGDEKYVHVGSINGSEASSKVNRELALQVRSPGAYDYLRGVFEYDWAHSAGPYEALLPLVTRSFVGKSDHVLISEVLFKLEGDDELGEWIELYNPTADAVDLSGWHLGDAARARDYEGMYAFPQGTILPPGGVLVVARQSGAYRALGYVGKPLPDLECLDSSAVPNMISVAWGEGELSLGNAGDEVLLLDPAMKAVDVLVYGSGAYPMVSSFGDVSGVYNGDSLERWPANRDSNACQRDFRIRYAPEPGSVIVW